MNWMKNNIVAFIFAIATSVLLVYVADLQNEIDSLKARYRDLEPAPEGSRVYAVGPDGTIYAYVSSSWITKQAEKNWADYLKNKASR